MFLEVGLKVHKYYPVPMAALTSVQHPEISVLTGKLHEIKLVRFPKLIIIMRTPSCL
jgi:hypothetical protein